MGPDPKIFDDIARVAGGAVNIVSGLQQQIREDVKARIDEMASRMDLVPREDLDQALEQIRVLLSRVEVLEKRVDALEQPDSKKTTTKAAKSSKGNKDK